jgi:DNA-binding transcriptional MerR regulator
VVTCLRDAGLCIADLRRFTSLLRSDGEAGERAEFLTERRNELVRQAGALAAAVKVLDENIAYYGSRRGRSPLCPSSLRHAADAWADYRCQVTLGARQEVAPSRRSGLIPSEATSCRAVELS